MLVVANAPRDYPPTQYTPKDRVGKADWSIYNRLAFTSVTPSEARPVLLLAAQGFDTVAIAQVCDIKTSVSDAFKRALMAWVAEGHKLIIQDSDICGGASSLPDYSFLPYPFSTSNPGAKGAKGRALVFVEENPLGNARPDDAGYLDLEAWIAGTRDNYNEIGDSNTVKTYDPRWCGHLFGTNFLRINGFMEAYTHYGRGLIIYNGFDKDQYRGSAYRQLLTRELAQPFDPDNLPCSARLADFVITTEGRLKSQWMTPAKTYSYPLTLLSNQAYKGTIKLTAASTPADPTLQFQFEPDTIALSEVEKATLTVRTTGESPRGLHTLAVRGTDTAGKTNLLCLNLTERMTGSIGVTSGLQRTKKPTKNLEIVLDASGSMKLPLGKKTRWATALDVLQEVVAKLPDDFSVGLRLYGHRELPTSPRTCTDSQLVVPIRPLDRAALLAAAGKFKPLGETPLVYSVLQTPSDLKIAGGGTVIVITDGEESCKGDPQAAVKRLGESGVNVTLNIVGFTLTAKQAQSQLAAFAEATGGHYYGAQNGQALARALLIAAVEKFPYAIVDASGRQVAAGEAGASVAELPPGEYKVVVTAGDQELTAGPIKIAPGLDVVLKVVLKGDRFVLER